jgi:hypothetical protein
MTAESFGSGVAHVRVVVTHRFSTPNRYAWEFARGLPVKDLAVESLMFISRRGRKLVRPAGSSEATVRKRYQEEISGRDK